jgi:hypothetical protein
MYSNHVFPLPQPLLTPQNRLALYHVIVVLDGVSLSVGVDGLHQTFGQSHFKSETYTHWSVFRRFAAAHDDLLPTAAFTVAYRV